jgi:hypothetical protein
MNIAQPCLLGEKRPCICCPTCRPRTDPCITRSKPKKDKDRAFPRLVLQSFLHQNPPSKPSIDDFSPLPSLNSRLLASPSATERRPRRLSQYHGIRATSKCSCPLSTSTSIGHCSRLIVGTLGKKKKKNALILGLQKRRRRCSKLGPLFLREADGRHSVSPDDNG